MHGTGFLAIASSPAEVPSVGGHGEKPETVRMPHVA